MHSIIVRNMSYYYTSVNLLHNLQYIWNTFYLSLQ